MCFFLLAVVLAPSQEAAVRKLIQEADAAYVRRSEAGFADKAVEGYRKALALDSASEEAYWKLARCLFWTGRHEADVEKKARLHKDAVEYAKLAVAVNEESVPGHFWLGLHYALYGDAKGAGQSLHLVEPVKKEMEWVIKKDETYLGGAAHRVLGRLYFKLPGLIGGDNEKAIQHLKRSIEIHPVNAPSRAFLAEVYLSQGRKEDAVRELKRIIDDPLDPGWEPEDREEKEAARKRLQEMGE
jgi:tetratricopeptide (TPR) repeat protein